ncbi:MAG: alpha/beta hydrolase [Leptolyngbya sp. SIO1E4]|nr:alpha/beta hydrolase [Leptolyngbya sp. SIO1E4]
MSRIALSYGSQTGYPEGVAEALHEKPTTPEVLWLNVSPSFQRLDQKLLLCLANRSRVAHWAYFQTPDEPSSLEVALTLLHDYVKGCDRPLHLVGHSTSGLLGLLYARQFPRRVKSLTVLSVGVNPAVDWKAHYYTQLELLPCTRSRVLTQMVYTLFGRQQVHALKGWMELLEADLTQSFSLHSLMQRFSLFPASVPVPLLVCGGHHDAIVDPVQLQGWQPWLKPGDRMWLCPGGRHFFHATHPQRVANQIFSFWDTTDPQATPSICLQSAYS